MAWQYPEIDLYLCRFVKNKRPIEEMQQKLGAYNLHREALLSLSPPASEQERSAAVNFFRSKECKKDIAFMLKKHPEWQTDSIKKQFDFSDIKV